MISHKYRFIFIHVPKAAGTTIEGLSAIYDGVLHWSEPRKNGKGLLPYGTMRRSNLARTLNAYPHYYVFAFVRDPLDRAISAYLHSQRRQRASREYPAVLEMTFEEYTTHLRNVHSRESRVNTKHVGLSVWDSYHTRPQSSFLPGAANEIFGVPLDAAVTLDFMGRVESFDKDIRRVLAAVGLPNDTQLEHERNASSAARKSELLTEVAIANVVATYAEDYSILGYDLPS